jgi:FkbM family methyltransferase
MSNVQAISSFLQSIPEFRGKRRICRVLVKIFGLSGKKNLVVSTKSGKFLLPNIEEIVSFELFVNGYYEKGLVELLIKGIPRDGIFFDVGANIGSIAIPVALARPDIKVVAIEASPWIFSVLEKNISQNSSENIAIYNNAVYNKSGMELPMYAPRDLFGKGSLRPVYTDKAELVNTITVDDLVIRSGVASVDFLKVDVEGFEKCVFEGMSNTILRSKPSIVFEYAASTEKAAGFSAGEAQHVLLERGYELQCLSHEFQPIGMKQAVMINDQSANILAS